MFNNLLKIGAAVLAVDEIATNIENENRIKKNPNAELKSSISDKACEGLTKAAVFGFAALYDGARQLFS